MLPQCLLKDFEKRKRAAELLSHPFITSINDKKARNALLNNQHLQMLADPSLQRERGGSPTKGVGAPGAPSGTAEVDSRLPLKDLDQLATQGDLSEATLVTVLQKRFNAGIVYTHIGDVLLAMNPYRNVPQYDEAYKACYSLVEPSPSLRPHIFGVALHTFKAMAYEGINQSCVVSGESGAGKTETAKYFVRHLLDLCLDDGEEQHSMLHRYELMQYAMNDLLEAFGNARTRANKNSSRFGKYMEIGFNDRHEAVGAMVSHYLLEKARVVHQLEGERNFHVFYYLLLGLDRPRLRAYQLTGNVADYAYVNGGIMPEERTNGKVPLVSTGPADSHDMFVNMRKMMLVSEHQGYTGCVC